MNDHLLELLIKQYLAEKDITKGTFELYDTILKQFTLSDHFEACRPYATIVTY
jgi:hypothetical protein